MFEQGSRPQAPRVISKLFVLAVASMLVLTPGCFEDTTTPPPTVTISPGDVTLNVGQMQQFTSTVTGGALNATVVWELAPVSGSAMLAVNGGVATVTAQGSGTVLLRAALSSGESDTVTITIPAVTLATTPDSVRSLIGQETMVTGTITNAVNTGVTFRARAAGIVVVAGAAGNTARVRGFAPGTVVVDAISVADTSVRREIRFRVVGPTFRFDSVTHGRTGRRLPIDSLRWRPTLHGSIEDTPIGDSLRSRIRIGMDMTGDWCDPAVLLGGRFRIDCRFSTTRFDTTAGPFVINPNGASMMWLELYRNDLTTRVARDSMPIGLANRDQLVVRSNVVNTDTLGYYGKDVRFKVYPLFFSRSHDPAQVKVKLSGTLSAGFGTIEFLPGDFRDAPFEFAVDPMRSGMAEGAFTIKPWGLDAVGGPLDDDVKEDEFPIKFDLLAPRIALDEQPPSVIDLRELAVRLTHETGPYAAGSMIPLRRILNGLDIPPHPTTCNVRHLHGNIIIQRENGSGTDGPFTDPEITRGDQCGHGEIFNWTRPSVGFRFRGTITDLNLATSYLQLYRAVGTCDPGAIVDDIPIVQGSAPGQSPMPRIDLGTMRVFDTVLNLFTDETSAGDYCARLEAMDRARNVFGESIGNPRTIRFGVRLRF